VAWPMPLEAPVITTTGLGEDAKTLDGLAGKAVVMVRRAAQTLRGATKGKTLFVTALAAQRRRTAALARRICIQTARSACVSSAKRYG